MKDDLARRVKGKVQKRPLEDENERNGEKRVGVGGPWNRASVSPSRGTRKKAKRTQNRNEPKQESWAWEKRAPFETRFLRGNKETRTEL